MPRPVPTTRPSRGTAAAIAAGALLVPAVMSIGANPSPTNPQIFFWYRTLRQPPWKPPDALIPVAWMALESGLAMGAYRLLRADPSPERSKALAALGYSVVMIGGWSRLFFRQHDLPLCIAAAGTMVVSGVAYTAAARQIDRPAAAAGLPFIAWVSFATALTWSIWRRNRS